MSITPTRPSELSADWLSDALLHRGVIEKARVASFEVSPVDDQGQTGEVVRIALHYDRTELSAPAVLIGKFAAPFEQARAQMHALGLYEREVRFYQDFGDDAGIPIPRCHHAEIDPSTGNFVLLLEDVGAGRNGSLWGSSVEDVELAVRHLAAFHAKWWEHPAIHASTWLMKPTNTAYYRDALGPVLDIFIPVLKQKFPESFSGYLLATAERLRARWEQFITPAPGTRMTLTHGDYHPKQIFFPEGERGSFTVFDWQGVSVAAGAMDLQRILVTGLAPAVLAEHQDRLIALYHQILTEHGIDYPLSQVVSETWYASLWTLYITIFAIGTTDVEILERQGREQGMDFEQRFLCDLTEILERNDVSAMIP